MNQCGHLDRYSYIIGNYIDLNNLQAGVRPGMTPVLTQQLLARPPNPATSGAQLNQQAAGSQQMMQGGPRTQEVIWEGELQWKENVKAADGTSVSSGNKTVHTVRCQAKASKVGQTYCSYLNSRCMCIGFAGCWTREFRG